MSVKIGDVVRLKSGGPKMTIEGLVSGDINEPTSRLACAWFDDNNRLQRDRFKYGVLVSVARKAIQA